MPNTSSICPSVLIEHQLVSDRQTTGHASIVSCRKKCAVPLYNTWRDLGKYISWYDSNRLARFWFFVVINAVVNFGYIVQIRFSDVQMPSVLWCCWLGGRKGIRPVKKTEWWGAGVVICLERRADLHMAQLMPLPLTISCFSKIKIGFTFLVPAHLGNPGKRAVKR